MIRDGDDGLWGSISHVYGLFFNRQKRKFAVAITCAEQALDLYSFKSILDVGCGTGALCAVLHSMGLDVTGIDSSNKMLAIARRKNKAAPVRFLPADAIERFPFEDNSFDCSITSYVAHGLQPHERKQLYREMSRVSRHYVIIYDYNQKRSFLTNVIEGLERGDYVRFIGQAEDELRACSTELSKCFSEVRCIDVDTRAAWYICKPE